MLTGPTLPFRLLKRGSFADTTSVEIASLLTFAQDALNSTCVQGFNGGIGFS